VIVLAASDVTLPDADLVVEVSVPLRRRVAVEPLDELDRRWRLRVDVARLELLEQVGERLVDRRRLISLRYTCHARMIPTPRRSTVRILAVDLAARMSAAVLYETASG